MKLLSNFFIKPNCHPSHPSCDVFVMFQVFVFLVYQYKSIVIESTLQLVHLIFHVWPLKTYEILSNHQFLTICLQLGVNSFVKIWLQKQHQRYSFKNIAIFIGKRQCLSLFLMKLQAFGHQEKNILEILWKVN